MSPYDIASDGICAEDCSHTACRWLWVGVAAEDTIYSILIDATKAWEAEFRVALGI